MIKSRSVRVEEIQDISVIKNYITKQYLLSIANKNAYLMIYIIY